MTISSPGIGSNLDVNGIVTKLMAVESQPLTDMAKKEASYQAQLSAYGNLSGALSSFQSAMSGMSGLSTFQALNATPGDATVLTAAADSTAVPGNYSIVTTNLVQAQTLMSVGQASATTSLGNALGSLSFQFGTAGTPSSFGAVQTVSIAANSSLQNIRDAVNTANIGVTATIVNDGSAINANHLLFTANSPGAANSMSVTAVDGNNKLQPIATYDQVGGSLVMTQPAAAMNAVLSVNGIPISSASNAVTGVVQGVTLNLGKPGTTTLNVTRNTAAVQAAIQGFVSAYNALNKTIKSMSGYDAATKSAGILLGDSTVQDIQSQIRKALSSPLTGLGGGLTALNQVGVSFQKDGTLAVDATKLQNAITNNFADISGLFSSVAKPTDALINYVGSTANTKAGNYAVYVTQLATQGSTTGNAAAGNLTIDATNNTLNVTADGVSATVTLASGVYTAATLATQLQTAINSTSAFSAAGTAVTVAQTGGVMTITSNRYGSPSNISIASGNGAVNLMGAAPTTAVGVDVAGTIGGYAATGSGQNLTGATGLATEGLQLKITGGAINAPRGVANFSNGYAYQMNKLMDRYLTGSSGTPGRIAGRTAGINSSITDIGHQRDAWNLRLADIEARYRKQFTALDVAIGQMSTTSSFLTQQLANLPKITG